LERSRNINGVQRGDRTGTGCTDAILFEGRYATTVDGVAEELLWFIKGSTNANELAEKDVHVWDVN